MPKKIVLWTIGALVGFPLLVAGLGKIAEFASFVELLRPHFPHPELLTRVVIAIELSLGLCLLLADHRRCAAAVCVVLLLIFTGASIYLRYKPDIETCHCFRGTRLDVLDRSMLTGIVRNGIMCLLAVLLIVIDKTTKSGDQRLNDHV